MEEFDALINLSRLEKLSSKKSHSGDYVTLYPPVYNGYAGGGKVGYAYQLIHQPEGITHQRAKNIFDQISRWLFENHPQIVAIVRWTKGSVREFAGSLVIYLTKKSLVTTRKSSFSGYKDCGFDDRKLYREFAKLTATKK